MESSVGAVGRDGHGGSGRLGGGSLGSLWKYFGKNCCRLSSAQTKTLPVYFCCLYFCHFLLCLHTRAHTHTDIHINIYIYIHITNALCLLCFFFLQVSRRNFSTWATREGTSEIPFDVAPHEASILIASSCSRSVSFHILRFHSSSEFKPQIRNAKIY